MYGKIDNGRTGNKKAAEESKKRSQQQVASARLTASGQSVFSARSVSFAPSLPASPSTLRLYDQPSGQSTAGVRPSDLSLPYLSF